MNLSKLFEMQAALDTHIEHEHPRHEGEDRLSKKILALQVELGELANEWRGFKFWSNDQKSRTKVIEFGFGEVKNPLLEEYVDCLHFILSIGLELGITFNRIAASNDFKDTNILFGSLFQTVSFVGCGANNLAPVEAYYEELFSDFIGLGQMLGFTWEQIEQAYYDKNAINHTRQNTGY